MSVQSRLLSAVASLLTLAVVAAASAEDLVLVSVTGPLAGKVGDRVSFEVELVNRSGRTLEKLRVIDYFDAGYHHEASTSPIEQKGTIDLAPGTARRLTLDFILDEPGRQCHRVEILDQAHAFVGGATHCVSVAAVAAPATAIVPATVTPAPVTTPVPAPTPLTTANATPAIELDLTGPAEVASGGTAEYVAVVRNTGTSPTPTLQLECGWEEGFAPLEASDGFSLGTQKVTWSLPPIEPGGQAKRQINLRGQAAPNTFSDSAPSRACVRAVVSGLAGGAMVADDSCLLVASTTPRPRLKSPADAGLRLSLADLDDPVREGDSTTLVCTVANEGTTASGRLDLVVILPDQARLVGDPSPSRVRVEDARVTFEAIPGIPPGGRQTFEITYRLPAGGTGKATAIVSGSDLNGKLERICQTTFLVR